MTGEPEGPVRGDATGVTEPDVGHLHEPIYRELAEPRDGHEPTPMWLIFLAMALLGWGGYYLGIYSGGFRGDVYTEQIGRAPSQEAAEKAPVDPMAMGRRIYNNCMSCHQRDGAGLPGTYPPLAGSEWIAGRPEVLVAIVLHGLQGEMTVGGISYDNDMPAWGDRLADEQIAAVLTYVRSSFGNTAPAVAPELVAAVRAGTADRRRPWRVAELEELAVDTGQGVVHGQQVVGR